MKYGIVIDIHYSVSQIFETGSSGEILGRKSNYFRLFLPILLVFIR